MRGEKRSHGCFGDVPPGQAQIRLLMLVMVRSLVDPLPPRWGAEVAEVAQKLPVTDIILDGEAIALHPDGKPHPFQLTMTRFGRKAHDEALRRELPLSVFFFDCMYADGSLIDRPWRERRDVLEKALDTKHITPTLITGDRAEAAAFYADALRHGHEGVMAKALEARYEAGRRGGGWLKIKSAHTLDLVVLAVEWGSGRREGFLSNIHLGARDPATGGTMELSNQYDHAWLNGANEYVMSDDPNFNPNGNLNGNWNQLEVVQAQP